jgi:hypothetical protein
MARIQLKTWRASLYVLKSPPPLGLSEGEIGIASETNTLYKRPDNHPTGELIPLGVKGKASVIHCRLVSTSNIETLNGLFTEDGFPIIIDNVEVLQNDQVLLTSQSNPAENGLYTITRTDWIRSIGAETWDNLVSSIYIITEGEKLDQTVWMCTSDLDDGIINESNVYLKNIVNQNLPFEDNLTKIKPNEVTGSVGILDTIPRADHIHPSDLTRAPLNSPQFTGDPRSPTPNLHDQSTKIATTEFVFNELDRQFETSITELQMDGSASLGTSPKIPRSDHIHPTDTTRAPLHSPVLTGIPQSTTPALTDHSTQIATTEFIHQINLSAFELDLTKLQMDGSASLGTSPKIPRSDHVHPTDITRAPITSPNFLGIPTADTALLETKSDQLATTNFVHNLLSDRYESDIENIQMDGEISLGILDNIARSDHIHPSDTSRAPIDSPIFTGTPTAPTADLGLSSTQLATTEFVVNEIENKYEIDVRNLKMAGSPSFGTVDRFARSDHIHPTDTTQAPIHSPEFLGIPKADTADVKTITTQLATTEFVNNEIIDRLENSHQNYKMDGEIPFQGILDNIARSDHIHPTDTTRAPLDSPEFIGTPTAYTASKKTSTRQIATTEFVMNEFRDQYELIPDNIKMAGEASVGILDKLSRSDHIHPSDTSRAPIESPTFTGIPTADTASLGDASTQLATTEFIINEFDDRFEKTSSNFKMNGDIGFPGVLDKIARSDHIHPSDTSRAPIDSPEFTGYPLAPTALSSSNTQQIATTEFVSKEFEIRFENSSSMVKMDGIATLGYSDKIARSDHIHPSDTSRAPIDSPIFTGTPTAPTPILVDRSLKLATTEFVKANIDLNPGRLGATGPSGKDGRDGKDGKNGQDGRDGQDGQDGEDGEDGQDGSNGQDGKDGKNGQNGQSGMDAKDGKDGKDGRDGKDGINGKNGKDAKDGKDGFNGQDGRDGKDGKDGRNGKNGTDGANGVNGLHGQNGNSGLNGQNGVNGSHGLNGSHGRDGKNGSNGQNGQNGLHGSNGQNGQNGSHGSHGINGQNGLHGSNGQNGQHGQHGSNGINGINGQHGQHGQHGLNGQNGYNGLHGQNGQNGQNGHHGINGQHGTHGTNGLPGTSGVSGTSGTNGEHGQPGTNGLNGLPGDHGHHGQHGQNGCNGTDGADGVGTQGPQGDRGPQGDPGTPATNPTTGPIHIDTGTFGSLPANRITGLPTGGTPSTFPAYVVGSNTVYQVLPSGLIIQCGWLDSATLAFGATLSRNFPISFSQGPYVSYQIGDGVINLNTTDAYTMTGAATASQLKVRCSVENLGFYYIAIGY